MAKTTRKRILSLLMTLVLAFSLLPISVFAAEDAVSSVSVETQDGMIVTVTGDSLPDGLSVTAEPVYAEDYLDSTTLETHEVVAAYDITLWLDGEVWQPEDHGTTVNVTITGLDVDADQSVDVFHDISRIKAPSTDAGVDGSNSGLQKQRTVCQAMVQTKRDYNVSVKAIDV